MANLRLRLPERTLLFVLPLDLIALWPGLDLEELPPRLPLP